MKGKGIKSAIAASALSAALCAGMLAGTTFAWFTDTVTSTGNRIMAGNLDIGATVAELDTGAESAQYQVGEYSLAFGESEAFEGEAIIKEAAFAPGEWNAKLLTVKNTGDLAAVVTLDFVITDDGLTEALWYDFVGVSGGAVTGEFDKRPMNTLATYSEGREYPVEAKGEISFIFLYGMNEEAGNDYQGESFGVDAYILARQATDGAEYEAMFTYAASAEDVQNAINAGEKVYITQDLNQEFSDYSSLKPGNIFALADGSEVSLGGNTVSIVSKSGYNGITYTGEGGTAILKDGTITIDNTAGTSWGTVGADGTTLVLENMTIRTDAFVQGNTSGGYAVVVKSNRKYPSKIILKNCVIDGNISIGDYSVLEAYDSQINGTIYAISSGKAVLSNTVYYGKTGSGTVTGGSLIGG